MLPIIDPSQVITVLMSSELNEERMIDILPTGEYKGEDAKKWDIYRDLVQVSFHHANRYHHFFLCDKFADIPIKEECNRVIGLYDSEEALVRAAMTFMWDAYGGERPDGRPGYQRYLVGWRTHLQGWPMLVNRCIKYRIPVLRAMRTDPEKKWPTIYSLVDIAGMYLQGSGDARNLPDLADLLRYWNVGPKKFTLLPEKMAQAICDTPQAVIDAIEPYLAAMHQVACDYYPCEAHDEPEYNDLVGKAVPPCPPLPVITKLID